MDFQELLNDYIELFSCTAKELADASGLTAVDISRYRTGKRTPDLSSPQLKKLAFGLAKLAQEHGKESITEGEIYNALPMHSERNPFPMPLPLSVSIRSSLFWISIFHRWRVF